MTNPEETKTNINTMMSDILCSAFEGGSDYWIQKARIKNGGDGLARYAHEIPASGGVLAIRIYEPAADMAEVYDLTRDMMVNGMTLAAAMHGRTVEEMYEDHDADVADAVLQMALFGKVIFG